MQTIQFLLESDRKRYFKVGLWILIAYFFLGISEGTFLAFENSRDTTINFLFTLVCVFSNWSLFKWLYHRFEGHFNSTAMRLIGLGLNVMVLSGLTTLLNWMYIELFWQEALQNTAFFPIVLPLAIVLFLGWTVVYHWLQGLAGQAASPEIVFEARKGREVMFCTLEETLGFVVEHKLVFLLHKEGQRLLIERSLTELEQELVANGYFRVNRQWLLNSKAIASYRTVENDRLEIRLNSAIGVDEFCFVSRYKATAFRKWLKSNPLFGHKSPTTQSIQGSNKSAQAS